MRVDADTRFIISGQCDHSFTLAVRGPLDRPAANALRLLLGDLEHDRVTIDLSGCECITDEGRHALADSFRRLEARGGRVDAGG